MLRTLRLPIALVTAVVVAEAAVLLLRPRDRGPEPVSVQPRAYFSEAEIERGDAFRRGQRWLFVAGTVIDVGLLIVLVARPPARTGPALPPPGARRRRGGRRAVGHARRREPARSTSPRASARATSVWSPRTGAATRGTGCAARRSERCWPAPAARCCWSAMRRFGSRWWLPGAVVVVGFGAVMTYAGPVVLDPIFNRFTPLPAGELRDRRARARQARRGRRRPGLRGRRVAADHGRQRLRRRPRRHQAGGDLRQPDRGLHARTRRGWWSPTSSATSTSTTCPGGCCGSRSSRRSGCSRRRCSPAAWRRPRQRGHRGGAAGRRALAGAAGAGDHLRLKPALARRRAPRGRLLDRAHARAGDADRLRAADRDHRTSRTSTPPAWWHVAAGHAPDHAGADRAGVAFERELSSARPAEAARPGRTRAGS